MVQGKPTMGAILVGTQPTAFWSSLWPLRLSNFITCRATCGPDLFSVGNFYISPVNCYTVKLFCYKVTATAQHRDTEMLEIDGEISITSDKQQTGEASREEHKH